MMTVSISSRIFVIQYTYIACLTYVFSVVSKRDCGQLGMSDMTMYTKEYKLVKAQMKL